MFSRADSLSYYKQFEALNSQQSTNMVRSKFESESVKGSVNPMRNNFMGLRPETTTNKTSSLHSSYNSNLFSSVERKNNIYGSKNSNNNSANNSNITNNMQNLNIDTNHFENSNSNNSRPYSSHLHMPNTSSNSYQQSYFKSNTSTLNNLLNGPKTTKNDYKKYELNNNKSRKNSQSLSRDQENYVAREESPIMKPSKYNNFTNSNNNNLMNKQKQLGGVAQSINFRDNQALFERSTNASNIYKSVNNEQLQQMKAQEKQEKQEKSIKKKPSISVTSCQSQKSEKQDKKQQLFEKDQELPNHEPTKCSFKRNGIVKGYAANTNQGLVRNYNEDRVSIILNIMKPASRQSEVWPKCSFFGIYDGHGGVLCADYLRDNLHQFVIKEPSFPWNPKEALKNGFMAAEKQFLEIAANPEKNNIPCNNANGIDRSGSCAIVVLIVGDMCYVANVGDSRAVLSGSNGTKTYTLSRDHKPCDELEQKRIIQGGGKIYQTQAQTVKQGPNNQKQNQILLGPLRVFPGRLSVSRTFGDIEAKEPKFNGNPDVVICNPEIKSFKITDDQDFIVLGCDGIFDKLSSKECIQCVWESTKEKADNIHKQCGLGVEYILRESLNQKSLDNVTVVMISFQNFKKKLFGQKSKKRPLEEKQIPQQQTIDLKSISQQYNNNPQQNSQNSNNNNNFNQKENNINMTNTMNSSQNSQQSKLKNIDTNTLKYNKTTANMNLKSYNSSQNSNSNNIKKSMKENFSYTGNMQQSNSQMNKLRQLDKKLAEMSSKVNQFSLQDKQRPSYQQLYGNNNNYY